MLIINRKENCKEKFEKKNTFFTVNTHIIRGLVRHDDVDYVHFAIN